MLAYQGSATALLDKVSLNYGPLDILGRVFLKCDNAARRRGLVLNFESLVSLAEVNRTNRDSWMPLFPVYDPEFWGQDDPNAFCIVGRNSVGEIVATQAVRLYDWRDTNFAAEAEALTLFYRNPNLHRGHTETCRVTAASAQKIYGKVALSGGVWFRPDFRGRHLTAIMVRIGRAYALGAWNIDYLTAMMSESVFSKQLYRQVGHTHIDQWIELYGSKLGDLRLKFMHMTTAHMIEDFSDFLVNFDTTVGSKADVAINDGSTKQHL